jgi:hypothetical protein
MRRRTYPLEPLAELRDRRVDQAAVTLAGAIGQRDQAEHGRRAAEATRDAHQAQADGIRAAEADALARGALCAADLANAGTWEVRVEAERAAMVSDVERAKATEHRTREGERLARGEVAARQADADVVAKDRARWVEAQRRQSEAKEEEAASEVWRPKR